MKFFLFLSLSLFKTLVAIISQNLKSVDLKFSEITHSMQCNGKSYRAHRARHYCTPYCTCMYIVYCILYMYTVSSGRKYFFSKDKLKYRRRERELCKDQLFTQILDFSLENISEHDLKLKMVTSILQVLNIIQRVLLSWQDHRIPILLVQKYNLEIMF